MTRNNREKTPSPTGNKKAPKNHNAHSGFPHPPLGNRVRPLSAHAKRRLKVTNNPTSIIVHSGFPNIPLVNRVRPRSARAKRGLRVTKNPKNANNEILQALRMKLRNNNLPYGVSLENVQKIRYALKKFNVKKINNNNKQEIEKTVGPLRIPLTNYGTLNIIKVFAILKKKHRSNFIKSRNEFNNSLKN